MGKSPTTKKTFLILTVLVVFVAFQNCQINNKFIADLAGPSLIAKADSGGGGISGNGSGYEGKPTGEYIRLIPNIARCQKNGNTPSAEFEKMSLDPITGQPTVQTTSPIDCQIKPRRLTDEVIEFSKNKFFGSVADGLFIDKDFAKNILKDRQPQGWCHSVDDHQEALNLDLLLVKDLVTNQVFAQIYIFDFVRNVYSSVEAFPVSFQEDKFSQTYIHPAMDLQVKTSFIRNSQAGTFEANLNMLLDEKKWTQNMSCRLAGYYDGAIWPAKPLLSGPLEGLTYSNPKKSFFFGLLDLPYTHLSLFNFDPITKISQPLSLHFLKDEVVRSFKVSQENDLVNLRTHASSIGVNRFMTYSVDQASVVYQSDPKEQVTDFGFSLLGPWYYSRVISSVSSTGTMFYATGENLHFPLSQQYIPEPIVLPGKDKLLDFDLKDVDFKNSKALIRVALGEKVTWSSDHKYLYMQFRNLYDDLALYDFKTTEFKMLEIGKKFGTQTHLSPFVKSASASTQLNGDWITTIVSDSASHKIVKYNFVTNETKILAETSILQKNVAAASWDYNIGIIPITRQALVYQGLNNYLQVLDLSTEKTSPLAPMIFFQELKIPPMFDFKNQFMMYWQPNEDRSLSPIVFDFTTLPVNSTVQSKAYPEAKIYFDEQRFHQLYLSKVQYPLLFYGNLIKTPDNYILFQAAPEANNKFKLYSLNLNQPNEPLQLLSNRYYPYGDVERYYPTNDNQLYLLMSHLPEAFIQKNGVDDRTKYLLKWDPENSR